MKTTRPIRSPGFTSKNTNSIKKKVFTSILAASLAIGVGGDHSA